MLWYYSFSNEGQFRNQIVTTNKDVRLLVNMKALYIFYFLELFSLYCPSYQISITYNGYRFLLQSCLLRIPLLDSHLVLPK
ncbi:hypothetical protein OIU79_021483 [Salix purpurea]|uniref:Uncharacterized protein n=1 Tax=Salix purpurea TaxID=77065 RepID=A0A9Q1AH05_SALPP|nr:hypothetical protein OIU79_021483 [Salix purpurea]